MLRYALAFFVIAILASAFGFFQLEGVARSLAGVFFVVFVIVLVLSLIFGRRGPSL